MNTRFKWPSLAAFLTLCASTFHSACVKKNLSSVDAEVTWLASSSTTEAAVEKALNSRMAFKVNLRTNRATLYKAGVAVDQWNIASADISGLYHNGEVQYTPTGIYTVDDFQMCPAWYPRNPINPATGLVVRSEVERAAVFAKNPSLYGPCGARNPLGRYVIWFNGAYGLHGNSNESILELPKANDRRVSGGCIRNPNNKIREVFHSILNTFDSLGGYKEQVLAMESRPMNARGTLTKTGSGLDVRVIVGHWPTDSAINASEENPTTLAPASNSKSLEQTSSTSESAVIPHTPNTAPVVAPQILVKPNKQYCNIGHVDSASNIAPVYSTVPNPSASIATFYRIDWPVSVHGDVEGTNFVKVSRGFIDKKYLINCSSGT